MVVAALRPAEHPAAHTPSRTGAREAEGSGLLSRPAGDRRVGSNPTPSASEPDRFSGASGQREVGPTGNEGRRSGSDQAAATIEQVAATPRCNHCGNLSWTLKQYGRPAHKCGCPERTDDFCQAHPQGCDDFTDIRNDAWRKSYQIMGPL